MKFQSIQALRAVAALAVLLFHLNGQVFHFGWAGVDLFFVISGFIMGTVGVRQNPVEFAKNRIFRVVPIYWLVTIVMCVMSVETHILSSFSFTSLELIKSLLFIPYFDTTGHIWPLIVPGWTLNYEMFFYGLFTLALFTANPIAISVSVLVFLVAAGMFVQPTSAPLQVWTSPLLLEFASGLVLATFTGRTGKHIGYTAVAAGLLGFVISALIYAEASDNQILRALTFGASSLLVVFGALSIETGGAWPRWLRPIEHVGDISYSIYLLHGLVLAAGAKILGTSVWAEIVAVAFVFLIAEGSYRLFEVRVSRLLRAPRYRARLFQALSALRG